MARNIRGLKRSCGASKKARSGHEYSTQRKWKQRTSSWYAAIQLDAAAIPGLARATYPKMVQNLAWAEGYNAFAIPLAAGVLYSLGVLHIPATGALLMSLSTVIVTINARMLKVRR